MHLEAVPLQIRYRHSDMIEIAAGKDVAADSPRLRAVVAEELAIGAFGRPGDRVMQIEPIGLEQPLDGREVTWIIGVANVLECRRNESEATLTVADLSAEEIEAAATRINCQADIQPLPLEDIYRVVVA